MMTMIPASVLRVSQSTSTTGTSASTWSLFRRRVCLSTTRIAVGTNSMTNRSRISKVPQMLEGISSPRINSECQRRRYSNSIVKNGIFSTSTQNNTTKQEPEVIAFIGLGNMGLPMAVNLSKSYASQDSNSSTNDKNIVKVVAYDNNVKAMEQAQILSQHQIHTVPTLQALWDDVYTSPTSSSSSSTSSMTTIITMLPDDDAVHTVMETLYDYTIQSPTMVVDCSTVSPMTSQYWHGQFLTKTQQQQQYSRHLDCHFIDAPVSGGVQGAKDATLTFMVGGIPPQQVVHNNGDNNDDDDENIKNILSQNLHSILLRMGRRVLDCGPTPGSGAVVKLCNNLALAAQMVGICEAIQLGEALGVHPQILTDVINVSTASCWSSKVNNPHPNVTVSTLDGAPSGTSSNPSSPPPPPSHNNYQGGFATRLMLKDLKLALHAASQHSKQQQQNVSLPIGSLTKELFQLVVNHGMGDSDFGVLYQFLRGERNPSSSTITTTTTTPPNSSATTSAGSHNNNQNNNQK